MMEYVSHHDAHMTEQFEQFKGTHEKKYAHEKEHAQRQHNFRQNLRLFNGDIIYLLFLKWFRVLKFFLYVDMWLEDHCIKINKIYFK